MYPVYCVVLFLLILYNSLCPVDFILTRMGAYDDMFSNASTFKVELDEWYVVQVYSGVKMLICCF